MVTRTERAHIRYALKLFDPLIAGYVISEDAKRAGRIVYDVYYGSPATIDDVIRTRDTLRNALEKS